jgi:WD40 repeat protein
MKKIALQLLLMFIISIVYSQEKNSLSGFETDNRIIYDICFTYHGEALGIADNNEIKVYNTKTKELLNEFKNAHRSQILAIDISKDSTLLVSGGKDSTIVIWDFVNNKIIKSLRFQKGIITSLDISPDGHYLVSGGTDNKIYLYDLETNEIIKEFNEHTDDITAVEFSPDGKLFTGAGADKLISIYSVENSKLLTSLPGHRSWVRALSFSQDGTKLITCGDDSRIITWNTSDPNKISMRNEVKVRNSWLLCIDNDQDNKTYAYGDFNGVVKVVGQFGRYRYRIGVPAGKILFKPYEGTNFKVAIATRGRGVLLIEGRNMKLITN